MTALSAEQKAKAVVRLVDDDPSVLRALSVFLEMNDWEVKTYAGGEAFLREPLDAPGCVILDVRMPGMTGIEVHREMIRRAMALPVIFLSAHGDIGLAVEAVKRGAQTFLEKPADPEKLLSEVESAVAADYARRRRNAELGELRTAWETLTDSERQVANLLAKGFSNQKVAQILGIAERTVRSHREHIYEKLDVENAVEILELLHEMRLLESGQEGEQ